MGVEGFFMPEIKYPYSFILRDILKLFFDR